MAGRTSGRARDPTRLGLAALALAAGVAIGLADSSPGWDSTGLTAGALFLSAAAFAGVARDRPWLWALLVGLPTPILDIVRTGNSGSILALGFAAAGAADRLGGPPGGLNEGPPRAVHQGMWTRPSASIGKCGLWAISQGWPSGSAA